MTRLIVSAVYFLIGTLAFSQSSIPNGAGVPDFTVIDTESNFISLSAITSAGFHVALNFVEDGCVDCLTTAPYIEESYLNYGCNVEEVVFITIVNGTTVDASNFEADYDFSFPVAASSTVASEYGIASYPSLLLISPSNVMLNNNIWPIASANNVEQAFFIQGINTDPCAPVGCTDPSAGNYDSMAMVNDGSCTYFIDLTGFTLTDIYGETLSLQAIIDGGQHLLMHFMGDWNVFDQDLVPEVNDLYTFFGCNNHDVFVVAMNNSANGDLSALDFVTNYGYLPPMVSQDGGSEAVRLAFGVNSFPTLLLVNPTSEIVGENLYAGVGNTLFTAAVVFDENNININSCTTPGCIDTTACNFDSLADTDDGSCVFDCSGCTDPSAVNFESTANDDNGSCFYVDCNNLGGIDWSALTTGLYGAYSEMTLGQSETADLAFNMTNSLFDPGTNTSYDVSQFVLQSVTGLPAGIDYEIDGILNGSMDLMVDEQACIQLTGTPTESGEFNVSFTGQLTILLFGSWTQFVAVFPHTINVLPMGTDVLGCTYSSAFNYDPLATLDNGSCIYAGCTNPLALNYNPIATMDDLSCILAEGICGPGTYWSLVWQQCVISPGCGADLNYDGVVDTVDLLQMLSQYGSVCD